MTNFTEPQPVPVHNLVGECSLYSNGRRSLGGARLKNKQGSSLGSNSFIQKFILMTQADSKDTALVEGLLPLSKVTLYVYLLTFVFISF